MNSNTKKKNRANTISKPVRPKGSQEKYVTIEGVYNNARFMHGAASLVGCIVQVQVKDGNLIEGVFKTFSPKMELVLEMPHTVDSTVVTVSTVHGLDPKLSSYINNYSTQDSVTEKLIFSLEDVVMVKAVNIDLDYATRGFTDSSISKFNGQILEKELEPWEEPPEGFDRTISLEPNKEDAKNGWDANEMFRTNAEKYGVTSTYDSTLQGYTVPLERKNTEEYKKQEAKAMKIALEIENSQQYRTRIALENGDEEEKYSAVIRPTENMHNNSNRYVPPQKRRNVPGSKVVRTITQPPSLHPSKLSQHVGPHAYSYGHNRPIATTTPSPLVTTVTTPSPNHASTKPSQTPVIPFQQQTISPHQPHHTVHYQEAKETRVNGGKMPQSKELRTTLPTENKENIPNVAHVTSNTTVTSQPVTSTSKPCEKRKDQERKGGNQKGRDEQLAEFKKFSSDFRLLDEQPKEQREQHRESAKQNIELVAGTKDTNKDFSVREQVKELPSGEPETPTGSDTASKKETLNPNTKEFALNPNAKSFTPRTQLAAATPPAPPVVQQQRMHTHSPAMALSQQPMIPPLGHPTLTMPPQYMMSSPGSMPLTPQIPQAAGVPQASKFSRKSLPMTMQLRHDIPPSVHVAAATGQPMLAPAAISTPPQLTMPYSSQGMIPTGGPPQPGISYAQIYSVFGPRMVPSQAVGMVPSSHAVSYGEYSQMGGHIYMSPHMGAAMGHSPHGVPMSALQNMIPQASSGPHSAPSTPQSQTPGTPLHAPSPVHQQPPGGHHITPAQTPTPTGHPGPTHTPQPVVYSQMLPQPSIQHGHHNHNTSQAPHINQSHPHPHHSSFSGTPHPQSMIFMPPTPHHSVAPPVPHTLHGHPIHGHNPGSHAGTPTHVIPHMPITVIPTSATMGPTPTPMVSAPFIGHPQGSIIREHL